MDQVNSGSTQAQAIFDDAVLYPNPYMVISQTGYTKHYYAGAERLATVIGGGGFGEMEFPIDKPTQQEQEIVYAFDKQYQQSDPFWQGKVMSSPVPTENIEGEQRGELDYQCKPTFLDYVDVQFMWDILLKPISVYERLNSKTEDIFFSHSDHLGSANWITDVGGNPIQYIHYAPYGELIDNQHASGSWYDERYKFTGKERDAETGYYAFGARYLWSDAGHWLSVDRFADKYPQISPYAYCNWNPIKFVDPDGRKIVVGTWYGRVLAKLGFNNFEAKVTAQLKELKNMDPALDEMITKIEEPTTEYHITDIDGNGFGYDDSKKEIYYNPDSKETKSGKKRPAQVGLAHELGHAENDVDGATVKYDKNKARQGDQVELDKWNKNELNSIDKENIVRDNYKCEERPYNYFTNEDY